MFDGPPNDSDNASGPWLGPNGSCESDYGTDRPVAVADSGTGHVGAIPGLKALWAETLGDPRICVAILDGPVDTTHPSLVDAKLTALPTLVRAGDHRGPATRHGTHVASVLFGRHDGPIKGIAPQCSGLVVPIFRDASDDSFAPCSQEDLARAIVQAVEHGAHVVNVSGGQFSPFATPHPLLADAVRRCAKDGVLIVAAAGNQGCDCLHVPGALPSVLAVGAMNARGEPLEFSNWGASYQMNGILALGEGILGAVPGGGIVANSGTSFATPIVSGVAALLLSQQFSGSRQPSVNAVRAAILGSARGCEHQATPDCRRLLAGRLDVDAARSLLAKEEEPGMPDQVVKSKQAVSLASSISAADAMSTRDWVEGVQAAAHTTSAPSEVVQDARMPNAGVGHQVDHELRSDCPNAEVPRRPEESPVGHQSAEITPLQVCGSEAVPVSREPGGRAEHSRPTSVEPSRSEMKPAACSCGGDGAAQPIFAIGTLGIDFGTEVRRDYFVSNYRDEIPNITSLAGMHQLLTRSIAGSAPDTWLGEKVIWTLSHDETPVYAIEPCGPYATDAYTILVRMLGDQLESAKEQPERTSVAGALGGTATLLTGQRIPVVCPDIRGLFNWQTKLLVERFTAALPEAQRAAAAQRIQRLLERLYYDFRNLGVTPSERALNFSMTVATNLQRALARVAEEETKQTERSFELDTIDVSPSPICRPDSECYDVKLIFFDRTQPWQSMRFVVRFAVDVSDVMPVAIGEPRSWYLR